ncbi:DUF58 domain-containing protein [Paeniglutamicibacter sp. ABSL32-1]|uniref:DUF58 domain-containing protein n=1 Tax=Paeniglutamicibacter quisquiliarum TaxID=2849498 RepID=UPI001C2D48B7|nr:DUF58 domain-containing protein [Paeniglutamicibacter quisquiliarum]MBV1779187.1 DUF58 domain-containing protein [Paeniglutamicibacter quisquiliarum]
MSTNSAEPGEFRESPSHGRFAIAQRPATLREKVHLGFLTARGWGLFASGAIALLLAFMLGRRELLAVSLFLLLTPLLAAFLLRFGNPALNVARTFNPPQATTDSPVRVRLHITHTGRAGASIPLTDTLPEDFGTGPGFSYPSRNAVQGSGSWYEYRLRPATRGIYAVGPVRAQVADVFGLAARPAALDAPSALIALPVCEALEPTGIPGEHGSHGQAASNRRLTPDSFEVMTREYRPGDTVRRIHWPATARRGSLMVRQEDYRATPRAVIMLDRSRAAFLAQGVGAEPTLSIPQFTSAPKDSSRRFEWALHAALGVGAYLAQTGFGIDLIDHRGQGVNDVSASGTEEAGELFAGPHATARMQQALAALGLEDAGAVRQDTARATLAAALKERMREHGDRLVLILGEPTEEQADAWLEVVGARSRVTVLCVANREAHLHPVISRFRQAGWSAVAVNPKTTLTEAWGELGRQT